MTLTQLRSQLSLCKSAGAPKMPVNLNILKGLIDDAEKWRKLSPALKEAATEESLAAKERVLRNFA